jgi:putative tryptophan/tyrosine transport system substrate-binding protein
MQFDRLKRRSFITLLAGSAVAWPLAARAQQTERLRRIGVLMGYAESDSDAQARIAAFREGLQKLGWSEGRNIQIDTRWPIPADLDAMQRFAREPVALQPNVILSHITPTTAALLQQTRTIPIVFATVADPVGSGFVASFSRPGGKVTGFTSIEPTMASKWLELLKEVAPRIARVAFLFNPVTAPYAEYFLNPFKAAAPSFGVEAIAALVRDTPELESVIAAQAREPNSGLIVTPDSFTHVHRAEITSLAARYRLPAVYPFRQFSEVGGLVSYGNDEHDNFRRAAAYVDRIRRAMILKKWARSNAWSIHCCNHWIGATAAGSRSLRPTMSTCSISRCGGASTHASKSPFLMMRHEGGTLKFANTCRN